MIEPLIICPYTNIEISPTLRIMFDLNWLLSRALMVLSFAEILSRKEP